MKILDEVEQAGTVVIRQAYIQMAGDVVAGSLLSQIIYWCRRDKNGKSKLTWYEDGKFWLYKHRKEIAYECGITIAQYKRAIKVLREMNLVETRVGSRSCLNYVLFRINEPQLSVLAYETMTARKANHKGELTWLI